MATQELLSSTMINLWLFEWKDAFVFFFPFPLSYNHLYYYCK